jgi:mono/diheme cytochrome c family protein
MIADARLRRPKSGANVRLPIVLLGVIALLVPALAAGQKSPPSKSADARDSAARGKLLFAEYCASCHGISGKGDGPVASALNVPPANLTLLARLNKGQFPSLKVMQAIKAGPSVPAHGSAAMPVWGSIFLRGGNTNTSGQAPPQSPEGAVEESEQPGRHAPTEAEVQLQIFDLTEYIKTLQVK